MFAHSLPNEVRAQIILLGTASPSARCFHTPADDEWTSLVLEAFKTGRIFHVDARRARCIQREREYQMLKLWDTPFLSALFRGEVA